MSLQQSEHYRATGVRMHICKRAKAENVCGNPPVLQPLWLFLSELFLTRAEATLKRRAQCHEGNAGLAMAWRARLARLTDSPATKRGDKEGDGVVK